MDSVEIGLVVEPTCSFPMVMRSQKTRKHCLKPGHWSLLTGIPARFRAVETGRDIGGVVSKSAAPIRAG